jgi:hypothetical protein
MLGISIFLRIYRGIPLVCLASRSYEIARQEYETLKAGVSRETEGRLLSAAKQEGRPRIL